MPVSCVLADNLRIMKSFMTFIHGALFGVVAELWSSKDKAVIKALEEQEAAFSARTELAVKKAIQSKEEELRAEIKEAVSQALEEQEGKNKVFFARRPKVRAAVLVAVPLLVFVVCLLPLAQELIRLNSQARESGIEFFDLLFAVFGIPSGSALLNAFGAIFVAFGGLLGLMHYDSKRVQTLETSLALVGIGGVIIIAASLLALGTGNICHLVSSDPVAIKCGIFPPIGIPSSK